MFERFSEDARRAIIYAQEEASHNDDTNINPLHLLIGMIDERTMPSPRHRARKVLEELGVSVEVLTRSAREKLSKKPREVSPKHNKGMPFTPALKEVFECTLQEARHLGQNDHIRSDHLLLALLNKTKVDNPALSVLEDAGLKLDDARMKANELFYRIETTKSV